MAHTPRHRAGGGSRRGQFGRSQGGGTDRAGNRYRAAGVHPFAISLSPNYYAVRFQMYSVLLGCNVGVLP